MSTLSLRLPESLHRKVRELAEQDDVSINQFIATAVAEKAAALLTVDYLAVRGRRGNIKLFDRLLARVPDLPPVPGDEMPKALAQTNKTRRSANQRRNRRKSSHASRAPRG